MPRPPHATRRRVVTGAVWTVPTLVAASAAPAYAVSCTTVPPLAAPAWTETESGLRNNGVSAFAAPSGYSLTNDPQINTVGEVVLTSPNVTFLAGRTYTFTFTYAFSGIQNTRTLNVSFTVAGQVLTTLNSDTTTPSTATLTLTYAPTTTVSGTAVFRFTFPSASSSAGDDVTIRNFASTCT